MTDAQFVRAVLEALRTPCSQEEALEVNAQCAADLEQVYLRRVETIVENYERSRIVLAPADLGPSVVNEAAMVLWGIHEEAAACSHRPEHIRKLFIDANAAHRFARALYEAGLLR